MWRQTWRSFSVAVAALLLLAVVIVVAATPPNHWSAPRSGPRVYEEVRLETVIVDLEQDGVIPSGSKWADPGLKDRQVSARWLFPRDREALEMLATSADVRIEFPAGHHGHILGPVVVSSSDQGGAGIFVAGTRVQP
jgi:hypothetical protein